MVYAWRSEQNILSKFANGGTAYNGCSAANSATVNQPAANTADELKKYKQLLDEGAITQEEYDAVKSEYLKGVLKK